MNRISHHNYRIHSDRCGALRQIRVCIPLNRFLHHSDRDISAMCLQTDRSVTWKFVPRLWLCCFLRHRSHWCFVRRIANLPGYVWLCHLWMLAVLVSGQFHCHSIHGQSKVHHHSRITMKNNGSCGRNILHCANGPFLLRSFVNRLCGRALN